MWYSLKIERIKMLDIVDAPISFKKLNDSGWKIATTLESGDKLSIAVNGNSITASGNLLQINERLTKNLSLAPWKKSIVKRAKTIDERANFSFLQTSAVQADINTIDIRPITKIPVPLFPNFSLSMFLDPFILQAICQVYEKGREGEKILALESARGYIEATIANRYLHLYATALSIEILLDKIGENSLFEKSFSYTHAEEKRSVTVAGKLDKQLHFHVNVIVKDETNGKAFIISNENGTIEPSSLILAIKHFNGMQNIKLHQNGMDHLSYQERKKTWTLEEEKSDFSKIVSIEDPSQFFKNGSCYFFNPKEMILEEVYSPEEAVRIIAKKVYNDIFGNILKFKIEG